MKEELLAELERSLIDLQRLSKENWRGIRQMKAHIRKVRNKLRELHFGKEAFLMERRYKCKSN